MMGLHEWLTFGNTTRTHQGAKGPPRERPTLPPFHTEISLRDMRGRFCGGTSLPHKTNEICAPRPRPNPSETKTRPTSSEEAASMLAKVYLEKYCSNFRSERRGRSKCVSRCGKRIRTVQRERDYLPTSTRLAIDPTTARKSRKRLGNMFRKFLPNGCSKEPSMPRNLCGHGHGRVPTSGGNCAMVTRRGPGFLFPSVLEGGELGELALTPAQMATTLQTRLRTARMDDIRYTIHSSRVRGGVSHSMDGTGAR